MASTSTRTLRLLSLLQARRYWPGPELAGRLRVSPRTLRRDIDRLRFSYTAAGGQHTGRHVEPHRLVLLGHRWSLAGYDLGRHDWRSFRLDRLTAPRGTGTRFRPRTLPAADAAAFVRAGVDSVSAGYDVEVLIQAPAAAVRQRISRWAAVEDIDATCCRVRMTADSLDWPVMAPGWSAPGSR